MPLTLITGPANAAKAGAVLERLRAALPHDPVLVVPTSADATHYARELAGAGLVFGAEVTTFPFLMRDLARAAGIRTRPLGRLARAQVVRAAVADVELRALKASARGPGFADALGDLFAELQRSLASPGRFATAVRAWREDAPAHAGELAALYSAYHARLEALEAVDADGLTHLALNAAREAWDGRPLFLYGFDELLPTQLDFVESLVRHTDTELTVAVTYEPGRAALAGSATTVELLKPLAREHLTLEPRSEHYAQSARSALHHLERGLFEPAGRRVPPNGAVRLLEAGGERAEAELVGASVLELLRDGMAPEDIAVLVRGRPASELFAQVFDTYGIPVAHERRTPFGETRLGAGLLAFARAARPGGTAQDVVTWLRTPGKLAAAPIVPAEDDQPRGTRPAPDTSPTGDPPAPLVASTPVADTEAPDEPQSALFAPAAAPASRSPRRRLALRPRRAGRLARRPRADRRPRRAGRPGGGRPVRRRRLRAPALRRVVGARVRGGAGRGVRHAGRRRRAGRSGPARVRGGGRHAGDGSAGRPAVVRRVRAARQARPARRGRRARDRRAPPTGRAVLPGPRGPARGRGAPGRGAHGS